VSWLHTPLPVVASFAAMLPRLEAEDSMRRATEIAVGTGSLKRDALSKVRRDWQRAAAGRAPVRVRTAGDFEHATEQLGVALVKVPS
jgi:hypothetical protein